MHTYFYACVHTCMLTSTQTLRSHDGSSHGWSCRSSCVAALCSAGSVGPPRAPNAMVHGHSPEAVARRRERARERGFLQHTPDGERFVGAETQLAPTVRAVARSLRLHREHVQLVGRPCHFVAAATAAACGAGRIGTAERQQAQRIHTEANRAKHDWRVAASGGPRWADESSDASSDAAVSTVAPTGGPGVDVASGGEDSEERAMAKSGVAAGVADDTGGVDLTALTSPPTALEAAVARMTEALQKHTADITALQRWSSGTRSPRTEGSAERTAVCTRTASAHHPRKAWCEGRLLRHLATTGGARASPELPYRRPSGPSLQHQRTGGRLGSRRRGLRAARRHDSTGSTR